MLRYYSFTRSNASKKTSRASIFNRFILLGVDRERQCVALFTDNIDHTKVLLKYFPDIQPGTRVDVLNPRLRGYIGETNTALITTSQPLIPYTLHSPLQNLLPKPVTENEDYSYFNFVTKDLQIGNATYVGNMCNSCLCDGSGDKNDPCGCISASFRATGLQMDLFCEEFDLDRVDVPIISHSSVMLGTIVMREKFDVFAMPSHTVDDGVRKFTEVQNANGGFRVIGWCRAPKETDHSISDAKLMHVVSCLPEGELSEIAKTARISLSENL